MRCRGPTTSRSNIVMMMIATASSDPAMSPMPSRAPRCIADLVSATENSTSSTAGSGTESGRKARTELPSSEVLTMPVRESSEGSGIQTDAARRPSSYRSADRRIFPCGP